jgi:hypothetical protein
MTKVQDPCYILSYNYVDSYVLLLLTQCALNMESSYTMLSLFSQFRDVAEAAIVQ